MNKKTIWYLPIEPMEERYTEQMIRWVSSALTEVVCELGNCKYSIIAPDEVSQKSVANGQWASSSRAIAYRSKQIDRVAELFGRGLISDGDVFLVGDVWFPGLESIKYLAEMENIKIKIIGWHYAGMSDPEDYLTRTLTSWGRRFESMILNHVVDSICVGSKFHARLIKESFNPRCTIRPYGLAWNTGSVRHGVNDNAKENIVVFPHRIAPEKQPEEFVKAVHYLKRSGASNWRYVISTNHIGSTIPKEWIDAGIELVRHETKKEYYDFLGKCKIFVSTATQETFGYALMEAISLGLTVVAPNRCSYPEMLNKDHRFLYSGEDLVYKLKEAMAYQHEVPVAWAARFNNSIHKFLIKELA